MWSYLKSWVVDTNETDDNLEDESLLAELDLLPEDELEEAVKHGVVTGKLFNYIKSIHASIGTIHILHQQRTGW